MPSAGIFRTEPAWVTPSLSTRTCRPSRWVMYFRNPITDSRKEMFREVCRSSPSRRNTLCGSERTVTLRSPGSWSGASSPSSSKMTSCLSGIPRSSKSSRGTSLRWTLRPRQIGQDFVGCFPLPWHTSQGLLHVLHERAHPHLLHRVSFTAARTTTFEVLL